MFFVQGQRLHFALKQSILLVCFIFISAGAFARIYDGRNGKEVQIQDVASVMAPGTILLLGEIHDNSAVAQAQLELLSEIRKQKQIPISVGMEFLGWKQQETVDQYLNQKLDEPNFLKNVEWGGFSYLNYKNQIWFPVLGFAEKGIEKLKGWTWGLNSPRYLSRKISKEGVESLNDEDKKLLPPIFEKGNELYYKRFISEVGHVTDPVKLMRYFWAQSLWDDTMAWKTIEKSRETEIFAVVVGDFHVKYGGGLPDRLKKQIQTGAIFSDTPSSNAPSSNAPSSNAAISGWKRKLVTISHVDLTDMTELEKREALLPHPEYGVRADFVFTFEK